MDQMVDVSDIGSLGFVLKRMANTASHFARLCEQKDAEIAELKQQLETNTDGRNTKSQRSKIEKR